MTTSNDNLKQCYHKDNCINPLGSWLPATTEYFYKQGEYLSSRCILCERKLKLDLYHADPDAKERQRLRAAERYRDPEYHARALEQKHRDYLKHREARIAKGRIYYQEKRLERDAYRDQWAKDNPDKERAMRQRAKTRRRLRESAADGGFSADDVNAIRAGQTDKRGILKCWWCGKPIKEKYHLDHVTPLARGGSNAPENLVISCPSCNLSKNDKLPQEWNGRLL